MKLLGRTNKGHKIHQYRCMGCDQEVEERSPSKAPYSADDWETVGYICSKCAHKMKKQHMDYITDLHREVE